MTTAAPEAATEPTTRWITEQVAGHTRLPVSAIAPDVPLGDYGLDSLTGFAVAAAAEDHFGVAVDTTALWDHATVGELAGLLDRMLAAAEADDA
ncbi:MULTISPECIES: acyl carrier protein [Streptomyces]|uniref:Acyl carrier protein n=1 Tax=Streptomyces lycii TaxID=2654337 RepID=A0ABQ7FKV5_9ACTN|nr:MULTISPECIES: acyl carrier protein [Streptomyces]KAF4408411.1 acyl carrier protein [Streptomyces lycii]PGH52648.1 polyketide synthase [Streptomyces sp. Ru87]